MQITVMVAAHKPYEMPQDRMYLPLFVGAGGKADIPGFARDDTGENISEKNASFCELTGLYWLWKNTQGSDAYGLCHYRRYFAKGSFLCRKKDRILTQGQARALLEKADAVLPKKRHYYIETRRQQYVHAHHEQDLQVTEQVLREMCPAYLPAWERMLKSRSGHIFNMFLMKREVFEGYCAWLFGILFEVERRLDISGYNASDRRVFGYLAERLMDVYLDTSAIRYTQCRVMNLEKQRWLQKGFRFVKRKFAKGKE